MPNAHSHMNIPCEQHYHDDLHDPFAAHFLQQSVCGVLRVEEGEYRENSHHNSIARGLRPRTVSLSPILLHLSMRCVF